MNIFLSIHFNIRFGCSKEPSHGDGSFEGTVLLSTHIYFDFETRKLIFDYTLLTRVKKKYPCEFISLIDFLKIGSKMKTRGPDGPEALT